MGENFTLQREEDNIHNRHAVSVVKEDVVGHAPHSDARVFIYFLRHGGTIDCEIIGKRKRGNGLEVPCQMQINQENCN